MMHKSLIEKIKDSFIRMGKKYRILLPLAIIGLFLTTLIINISQYIKGSGKKLLCLVFVLSFSFMVSSFSYPIFNYTNSFIEDKNEDVINIASSDLNLVQTNDDTVNIVIDDVISDTNINEYGHIEDNDAVSLEDILNDYEFKNNKSNENKEDTLDIGFNKDDWKLILVNKQHPIPEDYEFTLGKLSGSMQCDERIIDDLLLMLKEANDDGVKLIVCSPYRDLSKQESLFLRKINKYMKNGYSYIDAYKISSQSVTIPGASEHQLGLAIDIITPSYTVLDEGFEDTDAGKWLYEHCDEYGFVIRYPKGKEYITSIEYEPWHFRYVGKEAAKVIMDEEICLEEFWDKYL